MKLCREFQLYIIETHSLRKIFVSIKGIYYQAEIMDQTITWLVPHQFNQQIQKDVDYKVMLSFLELYENLMGFVLFRLYTKLGLRYPPTSTMLTKFKDDGDGENALDTVLLHLDIQEVTNTNVMKQTEDRIATIDQNKLAKNGFKCDGKYN